MPAPGDPLMQPRQRRFVVPTVFAVLALVLGWAAVKEGGDHGGAAEPAAGSPSAPRTPVLSGRRVAALLVAPIADGKLRDELDQVIADSPDDTCLVVSVGGRTVYEHNADTPVTPASTEKLVTATAALEVLGADTRLRTRVMAGAEPEDGTVKGDLYLVGGGDPLLATKPYVDHFKNQPQIRTSLESLADAVKAAGVTRVDGAVKADESRYDTDRYPDSWPQRYADQHQTGPLSALSVNDNFGDWPTTQTKEGTVESTPQADPPTAAADTLAGLLRARGITIGGGAGAGQSPPGAVEVAGIDSQPVKEIVRQLLTESDNQTAELLVKEVGRAKTGRGTTADGVKAVTATMEELGLARQGTGATDGSGLDEGNKVSCRLLVNILDRGGPSSVLGKGMAVAGKTGTLAERFGDSPAKGRLRAKTGTLNTVTALTGFANATQGPVLTFAYVANGEYVNPGLLKLQEAMGEDLVAYPQGPPLASVSPLR